MCGTGKARATQNPYLNTTIRSPEHFQEANLETLLSLMLGVSLSAACGFRIFVPMLAMSIAAQSGDLTLASGFEWIGSQEAFWVFAVATVLEVLAYYIPWLDNALDAIATPTAIVAGTLVTASAVADVSPLMQWTLAVVLGGSAAGLTQGMTDVVRLTSTATTGGLANPLVSTMELGSSTVLSILAIALPGVAALLVLLILFMAVRKLSRFIQRRRSRPQSSDA